MTYCIIYRLYRQPNHGWREDTENQRCNNNGKPWRRIGGYKRCRIHSLEYLWLKGFFLSKESTT